MYDYLNHCCFIYDKLSYEKLGGCSKFEGNKPTATIELAKKMSIYQVEIVKDDCCQLPFITIESVENIFCSNSHHIITRNKSLLFTCINQITTKTIKIYAESNFQVCEIRIFTGNIQLNT